MGSGQIQGGKEGKEVRKYHLLGYILENSVRHWKKASHIGYSNIDVFILCTDTDTDTEGMRDTEKIEGNREGRRTRGVNLERSRGIERGEGQGG